MKRITKWKLFDSYEVGMKCGVMISNLLYQDSSRWFYSYYKRGGYKRTYKRI